MQTAGGGLIPLIHSSINSPIRRAGNLSLGRHIRIARTFIASAFLWLGVTAASAFTADTANQLVFVNVDHAPVGALSTFAYGYKGAICGLGMSSAAIPYSGGGGGVIVALSGNAGLQALPFVAATASIGSSAAFFADANVQRTLTPCTDQWNVPGAGLAFTHFTPAWSMPEINTASQIDKKRFFLPATWMTFTITNNTGAAEDFYFGLPAAATPTSFANGAYQGFALGEAALAVQSGSCDLLSGSSLTAVLNGVTSGFAFHLGVPAGQTKSLTVVVAYYRSTVVDTRINATYYYTKLFSSMDNVIDSAFAEFPDAQARCQQLAMAMQNAGLNPYRQFLASDALHSYQCNTVYLVDPTNGVYWREVEGAYGNINTCDLMVDHAFYSAAMHPWALRNVLDTFSGAANAGVGYTFTHALYNETTGSQVSANGFSFQHEMGGNSSNGQVSNDPTTDPTEYETVFSYMGQEELDDWVTCAGLYWTHSGDNAWLTNNASLLRLCLNSELLRDDTNSASRDGVTTYVNYSTQSGKYEITTYDSLDPSLQDPRGGAYTAVKNWAAYLALQAMFNQLGDSANATIASNQAALCSSSVNNGWNATLGYIPASLAGNNTSATLPILEGLALAQWMGFTNATDRQAGPYAPMLQTLRNHALAVLVPGRCLDATSGGLKITSANDNTFPSKEFIAQYAAETVLGLTGNTVDGTVDQVNATLQMLQAPWQGLSDQINSPGGTTPANSSLHYPRGITSALWWLTPTNNPAYPVPPAAPAAPTGLTALAGNRQAVLIWNASAQAAGYNVKRGTTSGGPYYLVTAALTGASYTDTSVTNGVTYFYVVTATNQIGESGPSAEASLTLVPVLEPIAIQNYSFEAQSVNAGTYAVENPTSWSVSGPSAGVVALVHPNATDGRGFGNIPVSSMDGSNYCQIYSTGNNDNGIVYQDTGFKYRAGVTYTLTAAFGRENNSFPAGSLVFYNSALVAIASNQISSANLTLGLFKDFSVTYTGTGSEGGNGDIVVGFNLVGAPSGSAFDFDNVRLASPPVITSQPLSQTIAAGGTVSFRVGASGSSPLSCGWQAGPLGGPYTNLANGGQILGANTNILTITGVTTNRALTYQVIVTNVYGSLTSTPPAILTVLDLPIITVSPASQAVVAGSPISFVVNASGTGPFGYQWQANGGTGFTNLLNGGLVLGANSNVLSIASVTTNSALAYQVIVTNYFGAVTSSPAAVLTVTTINPITNMLIDVNFVTSGATTQTGAAVLGFSNDVWNALSASTSSITNSGGSLLGGVGLTLTDQGVFKNSGGSAMDAATTPLMQDYAYGTTGPSTVTVSLSGLAQYTNCAFTLVVYGAGDTNGQGIALRLTAGVTGGNTVSNLTTSATSRQISAGIGIAYQTFMGTLTNGTLTFVATNNGSIYTIVNGFQLQLVSPPTVSSDAYLTSLALSPAGILYPTFASNTFVYYATNAYGASPSVTITNANLNATNRLIYKGTTNVLASGVTSSALVLTLGQTNVLQVQVTAQDGVTLQSYMVAVTELPNQASPPNLIASVTGGTMNLSWRPDRLGYRLLMQTNNLNLGLSINSNDWGTVPGSTTTNLLAIPIVTTNLDEYYRLIYP